MNIAIIGGGVAGLTSAYLLSPHHKVTLYEKDSRLGGHAHTLQVREGLQVLAVDNGFMVFNPKRYPQFIALLAQLGVSSKGTNMSFGVSIPGAVTYRGDFPFGVFADRSNIVSVRFWKFLMAIIRFRKLAKRTLRKTPDTEQTLGAFLDKHSFSEDLANWFLFPVLSAIWSIKEPAKVRDFPAISTFIFLDNHKVLNNLQPRWRTIPGGSIQYVSRIQDFLAEQKTHVVLNSDITNINRGKDNVTIQVNGKLQQFDYVIFATHADVTKTLLTDISLKEKSALEKFTYSANTTVLHKDTRLAPDNQRVLSAWNYSHSVGDDNRTVASFTYCMNILQHIPKSTPVFVTLNPLITIDKDKIYAKEVYAHPQYSLRTLQGQKELTELQGVRRTFYAGAHLGYGFHEDGVVSAINIAKQLGITPPWN